MKIIRTSSFLASCFALAVSAVVSTAAASTGTAAGSVVLGGSEFGYPEVDFTFAAIQTDAAPATTLPFDANMVAYGGNGFVHEVVPSQPYEGDWTVDTFGVDGNTACFSGLADWGPPSGLQRYHICIVNSATCPSTDQWYSGWDIFGSTLGTMPIESGEMTVLSY